MQGSINELYRKRIVSRKLFGEFLLEKKLVTVDDLMAAMMKQFKETLSVLEVVYQENLLPKETMFDCLKIQVSTGCNFKTAMMKSGHYTKEMNDKISEEIIKSRRPLGEILVESGAIDYNVLGENLDSFLAEKIKCDNDHPGASQTQESDEIEPGEGSPQVIENIQFIGESEELPVVNNAEEISEQISLVGVIDGHLVDKLVTMFDPEKISSLKNYTDNDSDSVGILIGEWIAASRFVGAFLVFNLLRNCRNQLSNGNLSVDYLTNCVAVISEIVEILKSTGSETGFWEKEESKSKYLSLIS